MSECHLPDTAALGRMCERLRTDSEALAVIVIRADDAAYSVDPGVSPRSFGEMVENEIPNLVEDMAKKRTRTNHAAPR